MITPEQPRDLPDDHVGGHVPSPKPALVGNLLDMTVADIEKNGAWSSTMVRAGLLLDILNELYAHRARSNAALDAPVSAPSTDHVGGGEHREREVRARQVLRDTVRNSLGFESIAPEQENTIVEAMLTFAAPPSADAAMVEASAWLRECSTWLLSTDLDMKCPMEKDPLDIADALDLASRQHAGVWRMIESAPRDGTRFLAYEDGNHYALEWKPEYPEGGGYWSCYCGQYVTLTPEPTHWMPLPAAPATETGEMA